MRHVPKSTLVFATAALCCLGTIHDAVAAGMTGHVAAGKMAIDRVQNAALRDFLHKNETNFLLGTIYPDAVLLALQASKNPDADEISHGRKQNNCETPRGIPARVWSRYWADCPQGPAGDAKCAQDLAFFLGMVTHLVTDSPWHNQYIDVTTKGKCSAGGPSSIQRDADGSVGGSSSSGRHAVADSDFDFCLAGAVKGRRTDVPAPLLSIKDNFKTADRQGSYGCPSGQFPNAGFNGCYSCPDGYDHNPVFAVDTPGVCVKNVTNWKKAARQGTYGCPAGQFPNAKLDRCYSCPSGYNHNPLLPVDTSGVCALAADYKLKCSLVPSPPASMPKTLGPLNPGQNLAGNLAAALKLEGLVAQFEIIGLITAFSTGYTLQKDPAVEMVAITPAGPVCDWIIAHGIDGQGALSDCANESARFLDALWNHLGYKTDISVIRIGTYEYAIVKSGQVLHRNWHRLGCATASATTPRLPLGGNIPAESLSACTATNDQCIADDCHQAMLDCTAKPAPLPARANIYVSDGVSSWKRMLSTDGSTTQLYQVDDGSGRQRWRLQRLADGKYNIVIDGGTGNNKYLSTPPDGSVVNLYTVDDGSLRQRWDILPSSDGLSYNILIAGGVNNSARKYLSTRSDGSVVDLYSSDDGSGRQRWSLRSLDVPAVANLAVGGGVASENQVLSTPEDGSKIDLYRVDDGSGRQRWSLVLRPDGDYNLIVYGGTRNQRKYLSARSDGTALELSTSDDGSGRQRWKLQRSGDGVTYNIIVSKGVSGIVKYLSTRADGSGVDLYTTDDGSGRQRWTLLAR